MITFSNIINNVFKTSIISLIMLGVSFTQDNWDDFDATAYEFSATLSAAQIFIDGELKTTGKLAAFVGDELRGVDLDGATFFPPGGTTIWEVSLWSNQLSGETISFKYYDGSSVIDLNETIDFSSNDIIGNAFAPFELTGSGSDDDGGSGDCVTETDWDTFDATAYEFSATLSAAQVFIDGALKTEGQLAAFVGDEVRGVDLDGATFFPPGGTTIWEVSLWSNQLSGETISFKYFDGSVVIDLNETIDFTSNDIIGNAFGPFELTGSQPDCGGCADVDSDGICDDVDDCVGQVDECGVCNGDGIADGACDCDGNVLDCSGECGGDAVIDECGVCGGDGIADGTCDCDGNVLDCEGVCGGSSELDDCGVCEGGNADQDCNGDCFGDALIDDCGVCSGGNSGHDANSDQDCNGDCFGEALVDNCGVCAGGDTGINPDETCSGCTDPLAENYDETATIDDGTCVFSTGPAAFQFVQSTSQAFYYVFNANVQAQTDNGFPEPLASEDWVGAFKDLDGDGIGDVCVGAKKWDPSACLGGICDIALMGVDQFNLADTENYMEDGDVPVFMVYDQSENSFYDAKVSSSSGFYFEAIDYPWSDGGVQVVQEISVRYDCNVELGGHAFTDYCGNCVEGSTGLEENYADLGCGCGNDAPLTYCFDTDTDELGNPGTEELYCLSDDSIDCSSDFNDLWDLSDDDANFCYNNVPADWYLDCTDECINDSENDADGDEICGDVDDCPYDPENDADGDNICGDVDECPYDSQNDFDDDGICGDVDDCPYDPENDADGDNICGDVDECPYDPEDDADDDGICGNIDTCPYDYENDADGDNICGDVDECPYDFENDADDDGQCGDVDPCPYDAEDDADADGICGDVDTCPYDPENDADGDQICGDVDDCPYDQDNDLDADGICGDVDTCPNDYYNDIDGDGFCADVDSCPFDAENDIDGDGQCNCTLEGDDVELCDYISDPCPYDEDDDIDNDGICGDIDPCPFDNENDIDGDGFCGDVDECPYDFYNDADDDGQCGDVDPCPYDAEDDADADGICGDVDTCPYDPENDADGDTICGDLDECPYDPENDYDGDDICGDVDECPYDYENDADDDGLCGDVDECDYDPQNDIDNDGQCGDVDPCPFDDENDVDLDGICACTLDDTSFCIDEIDICSYDPDNDSDGDGLCCSDQDAGSYDEQEGIDDTGTDYFGNDVVGGPACECATNYFDCSFDEYDSLSWDGSCVVADSDDADTIDNCGTCDDIDWNDCDTAVIDLHDNANLSSFYTLPEDTSVQNIFAGVTSNLLAVASQSSAALYDDGQWSGSLIDLNQESGYWIVMNDADELSILGTPINPETSYALDEGSNLIGYPLNTNTEVLAGLGSEVDAGNIYAIFGEGISAYNYGGLWIGSLQYFTPNSGYWFLSNADIDFVYDNSDDLGRNSIEFTEVPKNPENFEYNQSKKQSFYYVESIEDIEINDWVLAYNNDVLVGARQYNGSMVDIPVMGDDNTEFTAGYCQEGDVPQFKLYRASNGMLNDLSGNINLWTSNSVDVIDNLSTTNIPTEISLSPAYPNPFNPSTNLSYNVPQDTHIKLSVYDINGRLVENLVNSYQDAGSYNTVWNASAVSSGVYFVTLTTSSDMLTQKIMLIK